MRKKIKERLKKALENHDNLLNPVVSKHIECSLLSANGVLGQILDDIIKDKNVVYNVWKDNKIVAKIIAYEK